MHHLQSQSGGILDSDDRVSDVADDREIIIASFDDSGPDPGVAQGGGDGASGSSVGTGSPDIFRGPNDVKYNGDDANDATTPHIEVTETSPANSSGLGLMVRRSSDPSLHQISEDFEQNHPTLNSINQYNSTTKRWSAAPVCRGDNDEAERISSKINTSGGSNYLSTAWGKRYRRRANKRDEQQCDAIHSGRTVVDAISGRWQWSSVDRCGGEGQHSIQLEIVAA